MLIENLRTLKGMVEAGIKLEVSVSMTNLGLAELIDAAIESTRRPVSEPPPVDTLLDVWTADGKRITDATFCDNKWWHMRDPHDIWRVIPLAVAWWRPIAHYSPKVPKESKT